MAGWKFGSRCILWHEIPHTADSTQQRIRYYCAIWGGNFSQFLTADDVQEDATLDNQNGVGIPLWPENNIIDFCYGCELFVFIYLWLAYQRAINLDTFFVCKISCHFSFHLIEINFCINRELVPNCGIRLIAAGHTMIEQTGDLSPYKFLQIFKVCPRL